MDCVPTLKLGHSKIRKTADSSFREIQTRSSRKREEITSIHPAGACISDPEHETSVTTELDLEGGEWFALPICLGMENFIFRIQS